MKKFKKLFIFGGGGHAKSCIDVILSDKSFKIKGIIDNKLKKRILDFPVFTDDFFKKKINKNNAFGLIGVGQITLSRWLG